MPQRADCFAHPRIDRTCPGKLGQAGCKNCPGRTNILSIQINMLTWDAIWDHFTVTREDKRQDYGEARLVCFGLLAAEVVVMVYTELPKGPHVISLRKAEKHEARYYRQAAKENLG